MTLQVYTTWGWWWRGGGPTPRPLRDTPLGAVCSVCHSGRIAPTVFIEAGEPIGLLDVVRGGPRDPAALRYWRATEDYLAGR
jgi:hypothetical protein